MRALVSLLAAVALAAPAFAQDAPGPNAIQVLDDCVSAHAQQLEVSHEAADVVAQAAVASCARELTAAAQGMGGALRSTSTSRDELKNSMRESALLEIVQTRAARNTPKPPPPPAEKPPARVRKKISP